jgi:hypothetical protein
LSEHPERDLYAVQEAVWEGRRRPFAGINLAHLMSPDDSSIAEDDYIPPMVEGGDGIERELMKELAGMTAPLAMLNPIASCFNLGVGPGTLVASFGIPLNPEMSNAPAFTRPVAEVLADLPPDPATSGLLAQMRYKIETIHRCTPPSFRIGFPDNQSPFNLLYSIVGNEALLLPYDDEESFHRLMTRITDFWIQVRHNLLEWISPERLMPFDRMARLSECSVNLVNREFYTRFILRHDRRISETFGPLHIHPCSGPHVFHATLENLPVISTEAGFIAKTIKGSISVEEALCTLGNRPILLQIGQELPEGQEYEFIRRDLDKYPTYPRLTFIYTGMHWRKKDRPSIREIHRHLDAYWDRHCA